MTTDENAPLRLRAFDLEDLGVVSSMVQDALVPGRDIKYMADEQSFLLALNRFQWESAGDLPPYSRSHAGLRFDHVTHVARRGFGPEAQDKIFALLAIAYHDNTVMLTFSGNAAIRLTVSKLAVGIKDLGTSWPTQWKPGHDPDAKAD
ncbi:MAG: DUF2948 family protein [Alphaproteobacteria bacterium]|nr:DUF2948 family protein [Alphaproteobacteria bacterium]